MTFAWRPTSSSWGSGHGCGSQRPSTGSYHTWINFSTILKSRLLSHSTELIVLNGNRGLKRLAEEGNESLQNNQRKTREHAARKFSLAAGDEDTFRLILIKLNSNSKTFTREQRLQLNVYLNKLKARVCLKQPLCESPGPSAMVLKLQGGHSLHQRMQETIWGSTPTRGWCFGRFIPLFQRGSAWKPKRYFPVNCQWNCQKL